MLHHPPLACLAVLHHPPLACLVVLHHPCSPAPRPASYCPPVVGHRDLVAVLLRPLARLQLQESLPVVHLSPAAQRASQRPGKIDEIKSAKSMLVCDERRSKAAHARAGKQTKEARHVRCVVPGRARRGSRGPSRMCAAKETWDAAEERRSSKRLRGARASVLEATPRRDACLRRTVGTSEEALQSSRESVCSKAPKLERSSQRS